jgi:hypothetical protein
MDETFNAEDGRSIMLSLQEMGVFSQRKVVRYI